VSILSHTEAVVAVGVYFLDFLGFSEKQHLRLRLLHLTYHWHHAFSLSNFLNKINFNLDFYFNFFKRAPLQFFNWIELEILAGF